VGRWLYTGGSYYRELGFFYRADFFYRREGGLLILGKEGADFFWVGRELTSYWEGGSESILFQGEGGGVNLFRGRWERTSSGRWVTSGKRKNTSSRGGIKLLLGRREADFVWTRGAPSEVRVLTSSGEGNAHMYTCG
jgi:hypothetical protein